MNSPIAAETLRALRRIMRASERNSRHLAASTGMISSQLLVMQEVDRRGETTPTVIATTLRFSQATVTNIVDRLVAAGYLTRTRADTDRRRMLLRVTDSGHAALNAAPDMLQDRFARHFVRLEKWEQAMIYASLERLADMLGTDDLEVSALLDDGHMESAVI